MMDTGVWIRWGEEEKTWKNERLGMERSFRSTKFPGALSYVFVCLFSVHFLGLSLSVYTIF